jgi:hypothetical protein
VPISSSPSGLYSISERADTSQSRGALATSTAPRVVIQKNMIMSPAEPEAKSDCTGEAHQQFTRPDPARPSPARPDPTRPDPTRPCVHIMKWIQHKHWNFSEGCSSHCCFVLVLQNARTWPTWICSQKLWPVDHNGGLVRPL